MVFPTLEHAYVAHKTDDQSVREEISKIETPGKAKRFGRKIELIDGWDGMKLDIMRRLVKQKFAEPELLNKLLATQGRDLIEGNLHGDTFFGQCPLGVGRNELGKILMSIRETYLLFN